MKTLKINPQVYDDLIDIKNYIFDDSPKEAEKVIKQILSDMELLQSFPESGTPLRNKIACSSKYRYITTYSYATIYYIEQDCIIVVTVLHLARDFTSLDLTNKLN